MRKAKIAGILVLFGVFLILSTFKVLGESSIFVDTSTGRITVKSSWEKLKEIEAMIPQFPLQTRQVQIEARILDLSEDAGKTFGMNLERLTGTNVPLETEEWTELGYGPETLTEVGKGVGALALTFFKLISGEERFEAILNMLISEGKAEVLASPQVTTASGETAGIYIVSDVPYVSSIDTETEVKEWDYATVGVTLQVLPKIVGDDLVQMFIVPIVGDVEYTAEGGFEHPIFKRQISPTNITVRSGESIVIGGLVQKKKTKILTRFPILSWLPVIGNLFKSWKEVEESRSLLITVKPRIITPREIKGRTKKVFCFKYALASEMAEQISEVISIQGVVELNPKEAPPNSVLVRDNEDIIEIIQEMLDKVGTFEWQKKQRTFLLRFSSPKLIKEVLLSSSLLSSGGSIQIDEATNSLIIEDGAYQLSRIEKAISLLEKSNQTP
ncbi:hypothetical protein E3J84_03050 [Candidatus Aerophobetes bacterium]|uniref:NolW-like domain-containing protein n=1 Tax=Aerophobetes bacterium TaxID=2030807 RepID=A0A523S093_UNCAE|nr:MAG: hypothetical protein E3J84_03050 [Candidatus Aerophobetes bacterium]